MTTDIQETVAVATFRYPLPLHLCAAKNDARDALLNVLFEGDEHGLRMVSADGFRMMFVSVQPQGLTTDEHEVSPFRVLVPATFLAEFWKQTRKKTYNDLHSELQVMNDKTVRYLHAGTNSWISVPTVDANYPHYERIVGDAVEILDKNEGWDMREVSLDAGFLGDVPRLFAGVPFVRWLPTAKVKPQVFIANMDGGVRAMHIVMPAEVAASTDFSRLEDWITPKVEAMRAHSAQLAREIFEKDKAIERYEAELKVRSQERQEALEELEVARKQLDDLRMGVATAMDEDIARQAPAAEAGPEGVNGPFVCCPGCESSDPAVEHNFVPEVCEKVTPEPKQCKHTGRCQRCIDAGRGQRCTGGYKKPCLNGCRGHAEKAEA